MTDDEIRRIVRSVLDEERNRRIEENDVIVLKTVSAILTSFGMNEDDRKEIREDFAHLRRWRKSVQCVESVGWTAAITFIATGLLAALWLGIKTSIGKP